MKKRSHVPLIMFWISHIYMGVRSGLSCSQLKRLSRIQYLQVVFKSLWSNSLIRLRLGVWVCVVLGLHERKSPKWVTFNWGFWQNSVRLLQEPLEWRSWYFGKNWCKIAERTSKTSCPITCLYSSPILKKMVPR